MLLHGETRLSLVMRESRTSRESNVHTVRQSLILQSRSPKTFFVPQNDEEVLQTIRDLQKQIFQLVYFGHMSAEYVAFLEISERNYMYELLIEQLESEKKQRENEEKKAKSASHSSYHPRR